MSLNLSQTLRLCITFSMRFYKDRPIAFQKVYTQPQPIFYLNLQDLSFYQHQFCKKPLMKFILIKTQDKKKPNFIIRDLYNYFLKCRDKIYNIQEENIMLDSNRIEKVRHDSRTNTHVIRILYDILRVNNDEIGSLQDAKNKFKNKEISQHRLGWFDYKSLRISIQPEISTIEHAMKKSFEGIIEKTLDQEEIEGFKYNKTVRGGITSLAELKKIFIKNFEDFLLWNFYPIYSILIILNLFDFYFMVREKRDYLNELIDIFKKTNQVTFLGQERRALVKDKFFLQNQLPDQFQTGIFEVDTLEIKKQIIKQIETNIQRIDQSLLIKLETILQQNEDKKTEIEELLAVEPNSIEKYLQLLQYTSSKELQKRISELQKSQDLANLIFQEIESNLIEIIVPLLNYFLNSRTWIGCLNNLIIKLKKKLETEKNNFKHELQEQMKSLFKQYTVVRERIKTFPEYFELQYNKWNLKVSMEIQESLSKLMEEGAQLRQKQLMLGQDQTNFDIFQGEMENFQKDIDFWEFCEKWCNKLNEIQDKMTFHSLKEKENVQREIVDQCREGSSLLIKIKMAITTIDNPSSPKTQRSKKATVAIDPQTMEKNQKFTQILNELLAIVQKFSSYMPIIMRIMDKCFLSKPVYIQQFLDAAFQAPEQKILTFYDELTINQMIEFDTIKFAKKIFKITVVELTPSLPIIQLIQSHSNSKSDYQIKEELDKIDQIILELIPKSKYLPICKQLEQIGWFATVNQKPIFKKFYELDFALKSVKNMICVLGCTDQVQINRMYFFMQFIQSQTKIYKEFFKFHKIMFQISPFYLVSIRYFEKFDISHPYQTLSNQYCQVLKNSVTNTKTHFQKHETDADRTNMDRKFIEYHENATKASKLKNIMISYIEKSRAQNARFYFVSDKTIFKIMSVHYSLEETRRVVLETFPGMRNIKFTKSDDQLQLYSFTNFYFEDFYPSTQIQVSREFDSKPDGKFPLLDFMLQLEDEARLMLKKNIFQNLYAILQCNYDFSSIFKLVFRKQLRFQALVLLNDISFFHDLTVILSSSDGTQIVLSDPSLKKHQVNLQNFKKHMTQNLEELVSQKQEKPKQFLAPNIFKQYNQLVLQILGHLEILEYFLTMDVRSLNSFEYLVQPKFSLEIPFSKMQGFIEQTVKQSAENLATEHGMPDIAYKSPFFAHIQTCIDSGREVKISLISMNYKLYYSYDLIEDAHDFLYTMSAQKIHFSVIQALHTISGGIVRCDSNTKRLKTIQTLASLLGRVVYTIPGGRTQDQILNYITGAAMGGYWLLIQDFDELSFQIVSLISSLTQLVRTALIEGREKVELGSNQIPLNYNFGILAELNFKSQVGLPQTLLDNFRVINHTAIDVQIILKHYLYLLNLPLNYAQRILYFINMMQQNQFTQMSKQKDFSNLITISKIIDIFKYSLEIQRVQGHLNATPELLSSYDVLKASFDIFFKGILVPDMMEFYQGLYQQFFNDQKPSLEVNDLIESRLFMDPIKEYFILNSQTLTDQFIKIVQNFMTLINQNSNIIISGRAGVGKSMLVNIGAHIYASSSESNFMVNTLPLDSIQPADLEKLLEKILESSLSNHDLLHEARREILLPLNEVLSHPARVKQIDKVVSDKIININIKQKYVSSSDWFIFDTGFIRPSNQTHVENILKIIDDGVLNFSSRNLKFPKEGRYIFEIEDLSTLSPCLISYYSLIYIQQPLFSVEQEIQTWLKQRTEMQIKFKEYEKYLKILLSEILSELLTYLGQIEKQLDKKHLLFNFLNVLEMMMNEIRKKDIAMGLFDHQSLDPESKKSAIIFNQTDITKELDQYQSVNDPVHGPISERTKYLVESIFVFSVLGGLCQQLNEAQKQNFCEFFQAQLNNYCKLEVFQKLKNQKNFAFNLKQQLEKSNNFFKYFFNIQDLKWVEWGPSHSSSEYQLISNSFTSNVLSIKELCRLNNKANQDEVQYEIENELDYKMLDYNDTIYIETLSLKRLQQLLTLSLSYNKKILLTSAPSYGKSSILQKQVRMLLKRNLNNIFHTKLSLNSDSKKFQKMVENKLIQHTQPNFLFLNQVQCYVLVDDIHMSRADFGPVSLMKQLVEFNGWYNGSKFITFVPFGMLGCCTLEENTFDQDHSNLPLAFAQKCLILNLGEAEEIKSIFSQKINKLYAQQEILIDTLLSFSNLLQQNKQYLTKLERKFEANIYQRSLSLISVMQKFKTNDVQTLLKTFIFLFDHVVCSGLSYGLGTNYDLKDKQYSDNFKDEVLKSHQIPAYLMHQFMTKSFIKHLPQERIIDEIQQRQQTVFSSLQPDLFKLMEIDSYHLFEKNILQSIENMKLPIPECVLSTDFTTLTMNVVQILLFTQIPEINILLEGARFEQVNYILNLTSFIQNTEYIYLKSYKSQDPQQVIEQAYTNIIIKQRKTICLVAIIGDAGVMDIFNLALNCSEYPLSETCQNSLITHMRGKKIYEKYNQNQILEICLHQFQKNFKLVLIQQGSTQNEQYNNFIRISLDRKTQFESAYPIGATLDQILNNVHIFTEQENKIIKTTFQSTKRFEESLKSAKKPLISTNEQLIRVVLPTIIKQIKTIFTTQQREFYEKGAYFQLTVGIKQQQQRMKDEHTILTKTLEEDRAFIEWNQSIIIQKKEKMQLLEKNQNEFITQINNLNAELQLFKTRKNNDKELALMNNCKQKLLKLDPEVFQKMMSKITKQSNTAIYVYIILVIMDEDFSIEKYGEISKTTLQINSEQFNDLVQNYCKLVNQKLFSFDLENLLPEAMTFIMGLFDSLPILDEKIDVGCQSDSQLHQIIEYLNLLLLIFRNQTYCMTNMQRLKNLYDKESYQLKICVEQIQEHTLRRNEIQKWVEDKINTECQNLLKLENMNNLIERTVKKLQDVQEIVLKSLEISSMGLESDEKILRDQVFALSIYLCFCARFPSGMRLDYLNGSHMTPLQIQFIKSIIIYTMGDKLGYLNLIKNHPYMTNMTASHIIMTEYFIQNPNMACTILLDPDYVAYHYFVKRGGVVPEFQTKNENTLKQIRQCIVDGLVLILVDPDPELSELVRDIYKLKFTQPKLGKIQFPRGGGEILIHKKFYLIIILNQTHTLDQLGDYFVVLNTSIDNQLQFNQAFSKLIIYEMKNEWWQGIIQQEIEKYKQENTRTEKGYGKLQNVLIFSSIHDNKSVEIFLNFNLDNFNNNIELFYQKIHKKTQDQNNVDCFELHTVYQKKLKHLYDEGMVLLGQDIGLNIYQLDKKMIKIHPLINFLYRAINIYEELALSTFHPLESYSKDLYVSIVKQVCESLKFDRILMVNKNLKKFIDLFIFEVYERFSCGLRDNHATVYSFQMGVDYLKMRGCMSDYQHQFLLRGGLDQIDSAVFLQSIQDNKYQILQYKMFNFYNLHPLIIPFYNIHSKNMNCSSLPIRIKAQNKLQQTVKERRSQSLYEYFLRLYEESIDLKYAPNKIKKMLTQDLQNQLEKTLKEKIQSNKILKKQKSIKNKIMLLKTKSQEFIEMHYTSPNHNLSFNFSFNQDLNKTAIDQILQMTKAFSNLNQSISNFGIIRIINEQRKALNTDKFNDKSYMNILNNIIIKNVLSFEEDFDTQTTDLFVKEKKPQNSSVSQEPETSQPVVSRIFRIKKQIHEINKNKGLPPELSQTLQNMVNIMDDQIFSNAVHELLNNQQLVQQFVRMQPQLLDYPQVPHFLQKYQLPSHYILLLLKYLKPSEVQVYMRDFFAHSFMSDIKLTIKNNIDGLIKNNTFNKFILIVLESSHVPFIDYLNIRSGVLNKKIVRVVLSTSKISSAVDTIRQAHLQGDWVLVEDIQACPMQDIKILMRSIEELKIQENLKNFKGFMILQGGYDGLASLFKDFFKVFMNPPKNIKTQLSIYYNQQIQQYLIQQQQESHDFILQEMNIQRVSMFDKVSQIIGSSTTKNTNLNSQQVLRKPNMLDTVKPQEELYPIIKQVMTVLNQPSLMQQSAIRFINLQTYLDKRQELQQEQLSFINLHTFLFRQKTASRSQNMDKHFYNLYFVLSIIRQRQVQQSDLLYLSDRDWKFIVEDVFQFLKHVQINPFIFINRYFYFIFGENESFNYQGFNYNIISSLFNDFVAGKIEKQRKFMIKQLTYTLYHSEGEEVDFDRKIFNIILSLPEEDPVQIKGYSLNQEILWNLDKSNKIIGLLNKHDFQKRNYEKNLVKFNSNSDKMIDKSQDLVDLIHSILELIKIDNIGLDDESLIIGVESGKLDFKCPKYVKNTTIEKKNSVMGQSFINKNSSNVPSKQKFQIVKLIESMAGESQVKVEDPVDIQRSKDIKSAQQIIGSMTAAVKSFFQRQIRKKIEYKTNPKQIETAVKKQSCLQIFQQLHIQNKEKPKFDYDIEQTSDKFQFVTDLLKNNSAKKIFLLNELIFCRQLLGCIKGDLTQAINYLNRDVYYSLAMEARINSIINSVQNNLVPHEWSRIGFTSSGQLSEFIKQFTQKCEHLYQVVIVRECVFFPSTSFYKLFHPFSLIISLLQEYSLRQLIPIYHLKVKLRRIGKLTEKQGFQVGGMMINGAVILSDSDYLNPEQTFDFQNELPHSFIEIMKRDDKMLKGLQASLIPFEFVDIVHKDLEYQLIEQQKKQQTKNDVKYEDHVKKRPPPKHKHVNEVEVLDMLNFVQIPIINPLSQFVDNTLQIRFAFIFKSVHPQEFWDKRQTQIHFQKF